MRYSELYLEDVVECQGDLFAIVASKGYDLVEFIKFYCNSTIREYIDNGNAVYLNKSGEEIFEWLIKKEDLRNKVKHSSCKEDCFMAEWIGCFYALYQWYADKDSKTILKEVKPMDILNRYNVLHDMDITLAVKRWIENRR